MAYLTDFIKKNFTHAFNQKNEPIVNLSDIPVEVLLGVIQKLSDANDLETIMFIVRRAVRELTKADGAFSVLDICISLRPNECLIILCKIDNLPHRLLDSIAFKSKNCTPHL